MLAPAYGMSMRQPAARWQDALPLGNGHIGAMMFGQLQEEFILLNHEKLFRRSEKPAMPDVADALPEVRKLLQQGRFQQAETFLNDKLADAGYEGRKIDPYQPLGNLRIHQDLPGAFGDYGRGIDFENGTALVQWTCGEVLYRREAFVSHADDAAVVRFWADRAGQLDLRLTLAPQGAHDTRIDTDTTEWDIEEHGVQFIARTEGDRTLVLTGRYEDGPEFGAVARVVAQGGQSDVHNATLELSAADNVLVVVKMFIDEPAEDAVKHLVSEIGELPESFEELLVQHGAENRRLFGRASIRLGDEGCQRPNEDLLNSGYEGDVPAALLERMFQFGRHLLIGSSGPAADWPAQLQGIWNGDYRPAWASDYHNNVNVQMNYWAALPGSLPELTLPLYNYYEQSCEDYAESARKAFGCRGIYLTHCQTTHAMAHTGPWINWTAGAGWFAQHFYDYYLFTGDEQFLRDRAIPFMKKTAEFYEDFLYVGADGKLVFAPSISPENRPANTGSLASINATMDVAVAREVLSNLIDACRTLQIEEKSVQRWESMLETMPEYTANEDGALREWLCDELDDNYHHRHLSHTYGLFPGFEITEETCPEVYEMIRRAVEKRLVVGLSSQSGWSLTYMANVYARLGMGNRALECLELLTRSCVGKNLLTYHNDWRAQGLTLYWGTQRRVPFQIDANFGLTNAMIEMLLFSRPGMIKLLPALPDKWVKGSAESLRARGGVTVSQRWNRETGIYEAEITSDHDQPLTVKLPAWLTDLSADLPEEALNASPLGNAYRVLTLKQGTPATLHGKLTQ